MEPLSDSARESLGKQMQFCCPTTLLEYRKFILGGSGKFAILLTRRVKTPRNNRVTSRGYRGWVPESSSARWPLQRATPYLYHHQTGQRVAPLVSLQRKIWVAVKLDRTERLKG